MLSEGLPYTETSISDAMIPPILSITNWRRSTTLAITALAALPVDMCPTS